MWDFLNTVVRPMDSQKSTVLFAAKWAVLCVVLCSGWMWLQGVVMGWAEVAWAGTFSGLFVCLELPFCANDLDCFQSLSFLLLVTLLASPIYLLDWQRPWQRWPAPTVVAVFSGLLLLQCQRHKIHEYLRKRL
jgi:hypothetical protein